MNRVIKLSTPWDHDFLKRTPGGKGIFGNYKFEINNNCSECDYWIVWGGLKEKAKVKCPPQHIIYVTDETHSERKFNNEFLHQFQTVIACRKDISHPHIVATHDLGIWHINKSYDEVLALNITHKSKLISIVSSDITFLQGHKKRFAYMNQMMGYFGNRADYYGRGTNPIDDKILGINDYKYSVAIENSFIDGYFTEKIFECFLTNTLPIYYGCPDLENYFDDRAFARIDINDYRAALNTTEDIIREDIQASRIPYLREAKRVYVEKYYFFPAVINIIERDALLRELSKKSVNVLYPEAHFQLTPLLKMYHQIKTIFPDRIIDTWHE